MQSVIMIIFSFVLGQCVLSIVTGNIINSTPPTARAETSPGRLTLNFQVYGVAQSIKLKLANRVLANKFLPIWISTGFPSLGFMKLNIMDELGGFTMYHDDCTKSAFVYLHKTCKLYGAINISYSIRGLPIDENKEVHQVPTKYLHRISRNEHHTRESTRSIVNTTFCPVRRNDVQNIYPELLVAISHDTYEAIERDSESPHGVATVLHVLTIYNAADMLYRSMPSATIQLNIAGIIIESSPHQWNFESRTPSFETYIDVNSISSKISHFFWYYESYFPRHSYDIIIYHTRYPLEDGTDDVILERYTEHCVAGLTTPTADGYMFPPQYRRYRLNSVIYDFDKYEHFKTIAHELAHIFGASHDDEGPYRHHFDTSCGNSLMSEYRGCSESCFKWSRQTEKEFAAFVRLPVSCNMRNYPRSLDLPLPKIVFSVSEQCECYGYESQLWSVSIPSDRCSRPLRCVSNSNKMVDTPWPMDGTPCGSKRVCWDGACLQYPNIE